jgi:ABC-type Fe3+-hydroxamate transport system substrate-binding protein
LAADQRRHRVVSLVPSVTETLSAWGVEPAACTRFCERPDLAHVGGTKNPDVAAIVDLAPDLVVVDRQENRREDAEALAAAGLTVLVLDVRSLDGLGADLDALADLVGVTVAPIAIPAPAPLGLRAFVPIWRRPWMTVGGDTYGSSLLAVIGIANVFADSSDDYPQIGLDEVGNILAGRAVTWSSNDLGVATVNGNGLVTARALGGAIITAKTDGKTALAAVTVSWR